MSSPEPRADTRFVVRLAIQATAPDPTTAVSAALDQVLLRGLENFTFSVEEVGGAATFFVTPSPHPDPDVVLYPSWGDSGPIGEGDEGIDHDDDDDEDYRGQFLG